MTLAHKSDVGRGHRRRVSRFPIARRKNFPHTRYKTLITEKYSMCCTHQCTRARALRCVNRSRCFAEYRFRRPREERATLFFPNYILNAHEHARQLQITRISPASTSMFFPTLAHVSSVNTRKQKCTRAFCSISLYRLCN